MRMVFSHMQVGVLRIKTAAFKRGSSCVAMNFQRQPASLFLLLAAAAALALLPGASAALSSKTRVVVGESELSFVTEVAQDVAASSAPVFPTRHVSDALAPSVFFEQNSSVSIYQQVAVSSVMKSIFPEYAVAITGLPRSIASAIVSPNPSDR